MTREQVAKKNGIDLYSREVRELMKTKYSKIEDEIALINNYIADPQKYAEEYAEYQAYRAECKARAREKYPKD